MLSDQKHENAGELRLRPAETMKANTGNGKLPAQKDEKAVIASYKGPRVEKYRGYPVWANTGMNKKKKKRYRRTLANRDGYISKEETGKSETE